MTRVDRIDRITGKLTAASELTLHRIETELGLRPRPDGHDAGRPWSPDDGPSGGSPSLKP